MYMFNKSQPRTGHTREPDPHVLINSFFTGKVFISTPRTPDRRMYCTHRCKFNTARGLQDPSSQRGQCVTRTSYRHRFLTRSSHLEVRVKDPAQVLNPDLTKSGLGTYTKSGLRTCAGKKSGLRARARAPLLHNAVVSRKRTVCPLPLQRADGR